MSSHLPGTGGGGEVCSSSKFTLSSEATDVWDMRWSFFFSGVSVSGTSVVGETSSSRSAAGGGVPDFGRLSEGLRWVRGRTGAVSTASSNVSCATGAVVSN
jgi:hypothetical protein